MKDHLWAIRCGDGHIDHTSLVYGPQEDCIEKFLSDEALFSRIAQDLSLYAGRERTMHPQGWASYEVMGYECVQVELVEQKAAKDTKGAESVASVQSLSGRSKGKS